MNKPVFTLVSSAIFLALLALPVMWLWNWLMPRIFMLTTISYWQALGLQTLCNLLFSNRGETGHCNNKTREDEMGDY